MRIQTMSVVVGSQACNARCPFCISKITGFDHLCKGADKVNWRNFDIACKLADKGGVTTALLTGKGEPTLFSNLITDYLKVLQTTCIPFKELQTNGIAIDDGSLPTVRTGKNSISTLEHWYNMGLTTVCLSIVSQYSKLNSEVYQPTVENHMNVQRTIAKIHSAGLMVRLSCMLLKGYVDSVERLEELINFCRYNKVKQLTVRPIDTPTHIDNEQTQWVKDHTLDPETVESMKNYLKTKGIPILELAHAGVVYDVSDQNVCWGTCITTNKSIEDMRQIIFFPDGTISYDWKFKAAVLL